MENIFKNSQNNGMVKANSTRNFLSLFQKQYETGLGNRGKQLLTKNTTSNTVVDPSKPKPKPNPYTGTDEIVRSSTQSKSI